MRISRDLFYFSAKFAKSRADGLKRTSADVRPFLSFVLATSTLALSPSAHAACTPAAAAGVVAVCSGTTTNQGGGAPGTSLGTSYLAVNGSVDEARMILPAPASLHLNGAADLGDGSGTCQACHGGVTGMGAHQVHLSATHRLRGPIPCSDCHAVPQMP